MLSEYLIQASEYVRATDLSASESKSKQIALSVLLGKTLLADLSAAGAPLSNPQVGEIAVAGGFRQVQLDIADSGPLTGLQLGIELKPIYRAAKRSIWNRFNDVAFAATNLHLRFPFCVTGAMMVVPSWSWEYAGIPAETAVPAGLLARRLAGQGRRVMPHEPPHLHEGIGLVVFDPDTALPLSSTYEELIGDLVAALQMRVV